MAPLDVPVLVLADVEDKWWNGCVVDRWPAWTMSCAREMARRAAEAWARWPNKRVVYHSQGHGGALGWNVVSRQNIRSGCLKRVCAWYVR